MPSRARNRDQRWALLPNSSKGAQDSNGNRLRVGDLLMDMGDLLTGQQYRVVEYIKNGAPRNCVQKVESKKEPPKDCYRMGVAARCTKLTKGNKHGKGEAV